MIHTDLAMFDRFFINEINSLSKQEQPPFSLFNFSPPPPFLDHPFPQEEEEIVKSNIPETLKNSAVSKDKPTMIGEKIPRKRTSKKDRHSKINTAQGPRDRRMRLSLEIARQFFDLQDMLGVDKASKTVEWLLVQSKKVIKELSTSVTQTKHSTSSECEISSTHKEEEKKNISKGKNFVTKEKKKLKEPRKGSYNPFGKESRARARERARERTLEKKRSGSLDESNKSPKIGTHNLNTQLGSSNLLETCEELGNQSHGTAISNNINFPNFLENWEIDATRSFSNYYAATNMHPSTGIVHEQLPDSIFMTTSGDISMQSHYGDIQF